MRRDAAGRHGGGRSVRPGFHGVGADGEVPRGRGCFFSGIDAYGLTGFHSSPSGEASGREQGAASTTRLPLPLSESAGGVPMRMLTLPPNRTWLLKPVKSLSSVQAKVLDEPLRTSKGLAVDGVPRLAAHPVVGKEAARTRSGRCPAPRRRPP